MGHFFTIILSAFLLIGEVPPRYIPPSQNDSCSGFKLSWEVEKDKSGNGKTVIIKPEGGSSPFIYIFYTDTGNLLSDDFKSNRVSGLAAGRYHCTVIDRDHCKKSLEIELK